MLLNKQYKILHVLILCIAFVVWVFFNINSDGNLIWNDRRQIYAILLSLYFTYVCTFFVGPKHGYNRGLLIFLALIAIVLHMLEHGWKWIQEKRNKFLDNRKQQIQKQKSKKVMNKLKRMYTYDVDTDHSTINVEFSVYMETMNYFQGNIKFLGLNTDCGLIEYNNDRHIFEISQYGCETSHTIPYSVKYDKWIKFQMKIVEGNTNKSLDLELYIDNTLVYNDKISYENDITKIYIGDDIGESIGFIKDVRISGY
tara:strand:- start:10491 stop:11255 length:765 start_codon:yes stop_codon:yes gene_type:complete